MADIATLKDPSNNVTMTRKRPPIDLRIYGADILLLGRFHRWQSTATTGADLDQLLARVAIDSTSPDRLTTDPDDQALLSFRSKEVRRIGPLEYGVDGELVTSSGKHPFGLVVEMPQGHNAFFALNFTAGRDVLGKAWSELVTGDSGAGGIDAERRLDPWAQMRGAELAAA